MLQALNRRIFMILAGAMAVLPSGARQAMAKIRVRTPAMSAGPFYPPVSQRFGDQDWDLVKIASRIGQAGGEVLHLSGMVLDRQGQAIENALVEIWQCDAAGRYLHQGDWAQHAKRDPDFQGYGVTKTDTQGRYRFRTIRPVPYPGRTPHIHARVVLPDQTSLVTQLFVDGDPGNARDGLFRSLDRQEREATLINLSQRGDGDLETQFDFVV